MSLKKETDAKRGTSSIYGPVTTGRATGIVGTEGSKVEYEIHLTGQMLSDLVVLDFVIPANTAFTKAVLVVEEAFDLATSSVVEVGTDGSEATNGVSITEANLESTGRTDITTAFAGTWDAEALLAADTTVGIAFSAGSVSDATVGKARLLLEAEKVL